MSTASFTMALNASKTGGGEWIHVVPAGTFTGRDGRGPYQLMDAGAFIRDTWRYAGPRKIPVDYDHQIDLAPRNGQTAIAAGWITDLQSRADGIWGRVEWTARADAHIAGGEYRYLSPAFAYSQDGKLKRLLRVSLTNNPNLNELTALFSSNTDPTPMEHLLEKLRQLLGLAPDADEVSVIDAVGSLISKNASGNVDPAQFVPLAEFERVLTERNSLNQGLARQAAQDHVEGHIRNANMPPYLRDWGVALCSVNKPAFDAFISRTKGHFNHLVAQHSAFNGAASGDRTSALTAEESAACRRMGITPEEFLASKTFIESGKA